MPIIKLNNEDCHFLFESCTLSYGDGTEIPVKGHTLTIAFKATWRKWFYYKLKIYLRRCVKWK